MTSYLDDEIVEEIRRRRQAHAESFDYDLKQIVKDLQRQERETGLPVVERQPRKPMAMPNRISV
jgi:hypothetical protein